MHMRDKLTLLLLLTCCVIFPGEALLFPLLFPVSIKITIQSNSKPTHAPSYHFQSVPVYQEVVVKGSAHVSPIKHSYGDGQKYGTSYGDGHVKVYTDAPHIRGHKYAKGYGSGTGGYIDGHFSITSNPATSSNPYKGNAYDSYGAPYPQTDQGIAYDTDMPSTHYKGTPYNDNAPPTHYKGTTYDDNAPPTHYKGTTYDDNVPPTHYKATTYDDNVPPTHYKGTTYDDNAPPTHYKGTPYDDKVPPTHHKGTSYGDKIPPTHYKGTAYEEDTPTHYKGAPYDDEGGHYKGGGGKPKLVYNPHQYIKAVGGDYKISDYINDSGKTTKYPDDGESYIALPPGQTYAEFEAAHKAAHGPKAYSADEYSDLGAIKKKKDYEHDSSYLDDTMPAYKANIPRPRPKGRPSRSQYTYQASASRYDRVLPEQSTKKTTYAGYGTSIYGDSYAKIVYAPKTLRISIKAYAHK